MKPEESGDSLDTFPKLLQHHVRQRPNRDAMREKDLGIWQSWTWAEAAAEIRALACGLASLGLGRGDKLAIIGDNRPRLYWGMTAAQALGAVPVPLYQDSVADEMAYVLDNADVRIALVEDQEQVDKMLEVRDRCPKLEHVIYEDDRGMRFYDQDFLQLFEFVQEIVFVVAQSAWIVKNHLLDLGAAIAYLEHLVDLFLVLDQRNPDVGIVEHVGHFIGDRVLVERYRHRAKGLCRGHTPVEARAIIADDGQLVAALQPEARQSAGERADFGRGLGPGPGLPDTEIFFTDRVAGRPLPDVTRQ